MFNYSQDHTQANLSVSLVKINFLSGFQEKHFNLTPKVGGPVCNTAVEKPGNNRTRNILRHSPGGIQYPEKSEVSLRARTLMLDVLI